MNIPSQFQISTAPVADSAAIVQTSHARFTLLTDRLIRIEYSPSAVFEDRASQAYWYRKQPVPRFQVQQSGDVLEIETEYLHLRYKATKQGFTPKTLSIHVKNTHATWHYGDKPWASGPLWGTARTLDGISGSTGLEPGPMGRAGFSVLDDSKSVVFTEDGWVTPRAHPENLDLYFYGYGHDYLACLRDFCKVSGAMPMIPRYILGNWWSRYWAYTQQELTSLMQDFQAHGIPLSVCIVDMDWHLAGWTGYTWNRELWPDPQGFIRWLHEVGLRTALNLHPSDGVGPHEEQYPQMAAALGVDPASQLPIQFDIANPAFAAAYFDILHHPYEAMGVDFWWMDWQQERVTRIPGLDPLWWLNHLHYLDLGRNGKRPFVFSRWGGLGNHRYPIGFSGDTHITWDSLSFQPFFTATAANVGYGWWSHDIGGHMSGIEDDELYTRWVQFGVFSPILRLHCTNNPYHERRPWGRGIAANQAASRALRLRHQLIPYIYSMAWRNHQHSIPLVTPMYYWNPEDDEAYHAEGQYWFGSELVVSPYVAPADPQVRLSRQRVWLPQGEWFHFFTGERLRGGQWRIVYGDLNDIPVYAKAGAIVPLAPEVAWGGVNNPETLEIHLFPGADNSFDLYEDDGETQNYLQQHYAITPLRQTWEGNALTFHIGPVKGELALVPPQRTYRLFVHSVAQPEDVWLTVNGARRASHWTYEAASETFVIEMEILHPTDSAVLRIGTSRDALISRENRLPEKMRHMLQAMPIESWLKLQLDRDLPALLEGSRSLRDYAGLSDAQLAALENAMLA